MLDPRLLNPVWHALADSQARYAVRSGEVARFPAEIAPFVAVATSQAQVDDDLRTLVAPGEWVDFVAVAPALGDAWRVARKEVIAQQHCAAALSIPEGGAIVRLGEIHADAMLALTRLVYPGYFRSRTRELGDNIGIFAGAELIAMAGERMRIGEWQEISAVCTHPSHLGRGHARRLITTLVNAILARGQRPFLHVSTKNERALALYRSLKFETRTEIDLWLAQRLR